MSVVADTGPLNYFVLIDEAELLGELFGQVLLPQAAFAEMQHARTPVKVREWLTGMPAWLDVRSAGATTNPLIAALGPGERGAIQLALDLGIQTVLIDDAEARQAAESVHLDVRGTLSILERGSRLGKVDLQQAFRKLEQTNFRMSAALRRAFLDRNL